MISAQQLMTGVMMGTILIVMGLVPGLLDTWANALSDFAELLLYGRSTRYPWRKHNRFSDLLSGLMAAGHRARREFTEHRWIAALGMAVIALSLFFYTSR